MKDRTGIKDGAAIVVCIVLWTTIMNGTVVMAWKSNLHQHVSRFCRAVLAPIDSCIPSPCGPNSQCTRRNNHVICSCIPGYIGSPPNCSRECEDNEDCAKDQHCTNGKCFNACVGSCGINAPCIAINHEPVCTCLPGQTGDPFDQCTDISPPPDPCVPSPCGPNSLCRPMGGDAFCSCLPEYMGSPPNCHQQCTVNGDCTREQICRNGECLNVCTGACGTEAECIAYGHKAACTCLPDQTGNPFKECTGTRRPPKPTDPCNPSPCAPNTECQLIDGIATCICLSGYQSWEGWIMENNERSAVGLCV